MGSTSVRIGRHTAREWIGFFITIVIFGLGACMVIGWIITGVSGGGWN